MLPKSALGLRVRRGRSTRSILASGVEGDHFAPWSQRPESLMELLTATSAFRSLPGESVSVGITGDHVDLSSFRRFVGLSPLFERRKRSCACGSLSHLITLRFATFANATCSSAGLRTLARQTLISPVLDHCSSRRRAPIARTSLDGVK